ncbi:MAG: hypothetical protein V4451_06960 [Pseudomonadota bacterium]
MFLAINSPDRHCGLDPQSMTPHSALKSKSWIPDQVRDDKTGDKARENPSLITMGISFEQPMAYPQAGRQTKSCSCFKAGLAGVFNTRLNNRQVLDQKGENSAIHR